MIKPKVLPREDWSHEIDGRWLLGWHNPFRYQRACDYADRHNVQVSMTGPMLLGRRSSKYMQPKRRRYTHR